MHSFVRHNRIPLLSLLTLSVFFALPLSVWGQNHTYTPLVGIPGIPTSGDVDLPTYFNSLYLLAISLGALIAVFKISVAGVKYSLSGIVTDKASAKHDIQNALLGLAILLIPFIVLNQIYPDLTNLNFLRNANSVRINLEPSSTNSSTNSGLADTNPQSSVAPAGTVFENCSYSRSATAPITDEFSAASASYEYDSTACRQSCAAKNGTFLSLGTDSGRCTYKADSTTMNTPEIPSGISS